MILTTETMAGLWASRETENAEMRGRSSKLQDYYEGRQLDHLDAIFAKIFANWSDNRGIVPLRTVNTTRKMIRTLAQAYKKPPARRIVDFEGNPIESPEYERYINEAHKAIVLKEAERMSILHGACFVKAEWDERRQEVRYRILLPYQADVITEADNAQEVAAVTYVVRRPSDKFGESNTEEHMIYWDAENSYEFTVAADIVLLDGSRITRDRVIFDDAATEELANPYGLLPFATFRTTFGLGEQFWPYIDDTWVSVNEAVNQFLTDLGMAENFQAFAQWWTRGGGVGTNTATGQSNAAELNLSRLSILELGHDAELGATSPESHIGEIIDVLELVMKLGSWANDVGEFSLAGAKQIQSGIAYIMDRYDTIENVHGRLDFYREAERDLFDIERAIINYHTDSAIPDGRLEVIFADPGGMLSTTERTEREVFELANHITTAAEILMSQRPDIRTREDAEAAIAANRAANTANQSRFNSTATASAANIENLSNQATPADTEGE